MFACMHLVTMSHPGRGLSEATVCWVHFFFLSSLPWDRFVFQYDCSVISRRKNILLFNFLLFIPPSSLYLLDPFMFVLASARLHHLLSCPHYLSPPPILAVVPFSFTSPPPALIHTIQMALRSVNKLVSIMCFFMLFHTSCLSAVR